MASLVIGASGGIGTAMVRHWGKSGAEVVGVSRQVDGFDLRVPDTVDQVLGRLDGPFDRVLVATGALAAPGHAPEKSLAAIDAAAMADVMMVNAIGTALILRHLPRLLAPKGRSVTGVLTARVGSIGDNALGGWHSYRASKAAANMLVRGAAIEIGRRRSEAVIAALHPGTIDTPFTAEYPAHRKVSAETAAARLDAVMADLTPAQSGGFYDYSGAEVAW